MAGVVIYDNTFPRLPPNVPSLGYQATGLAEFGDLVQFGGAPNRLLTSATVILSSWALASEWSASGAGYLHPLTFNVYDVDSSSGTPQPGTLLASATQTTLIPWRPEPGGGCGTGWLAGDSVCYNGFAFAVQFDFDKPLLPNQIVYGLSFNTQTYGAAPTA